MAKCGRGRSENFANVYANVWILENFGHKRGFYTYMYRLPPKEVWGVSARKLGKCV